MVTFEDDYRAIRRVVGGGFEGVGVVEGLTVFVNADGLSSHPPYVRAIQAAPNPLYPGGVMIIHGPVVVMGPTDDDGHTTGFTPALLPLAERVFRPVEA